jgi:hypothetical protein
MSAFVHVFPMAPAPLVYLSLGAALAGSDVLPAAFARLALVLGTAFALVGLTGLFVAPVLTLVVVGAQSLWVASAAVWLLARGPGPATRPAS